MKIIITFILLVLTGSVFAENTSSVLIFVSFSMPKKSIKGWITEAEKINAPVIIRGLINDSFKETLNAMRPLIKDNRGGLQIDPNLFREYNIEKVPAVVVRTQGNCFANQSCREDYDIVYGNVHLDYALETISKNEGVVGEKAKEALTVIRGKDHE